MRHTQLSVNCIIRCGQEYLLLRRKDTSSVNPSVLNVMGGKLEADDTYISAAIREAREETGDGVGEYIKNQARYKGTFIFTGGYAKDWIAHFYLFDVPHKNVPVGLNNHEGELVWIHQADVLKQADIIWDFYYCWDEIIDDTVEFSIRSVMDDNKKLLALHKTIVDRQGNLIRSVTIDGSEAIHPFDSV